MFWGDLLDAADKRMNFDIDDKFKQDGIDPFSVKVASSAQGVNMKFTQKFADGGKFKQKAEFSTKMDEHALECKVSNSKTEFEYSMAPGGMNSGGQCGSVVVGGDTNFKDDAWTAHAEVSAGGFEVGPMKPFTTINCETNNAGEHSLTYSQTVAMDAMHLGWKVAADKSAALTAAHAAAAMNADGKLMYARADILNKFFGMGCTMNQAMFGMQMKHAMELQYDASGSGAKGLAGQPAYFRYGADCVMSDTCNLAYNLTGGQDWIENYKATMAVDAKTKLVLSARGDIKAFFANPKNYVKGFGMGLEFKA